MILQFWPRKSASWYPVHFLAETGIKMIELSLRMRRDSSVGVALGYGLDYWSSRVRFPAVAGNFSLHHRVQNGSGSHPPPIQWVPGNLSLGVKRPGREADHTPPSSAKVKECVELHLHPQYAFMAWSSVKKSTGTNFTFFTFNFLFVLLSISNRFRLILWNILHQIKLKYLRTKAEINLFPLTKYHTMKTYHVLKYNSIKTYRGVEV
jgi:hypothetical protein